MEVEKIDHLCRTCGSGRLEKYTTKQGEKRIRCPNCEVDAVGWRASKLCFCGHRFPNGSRSYLKCVKNPERSPMSPHAIVVMLDEDAVKERRDNPRKAEKAQPDCDDLFGEAEEA